MDSIAEAKLSKFYKKYPLKSFKKGEVLIKDKKPTGVFFLTKGIVRMYTLSQNGSELTINIFKPTSFFPVGWALNDTPTRYFFDAITDVEAHIVPKDDVKTMLEKKHDIALDLLKRIYKGLDGYFLRVESLLEGEATFKTITALLIQTQRLGKTENNKSYEIRFTHSQLAKLSGLTRETVTREIKKLQDNDIVSYNGHTLIITDISILEAQLH